MEGIPLDDFLGHYKESPEIVEQIKRHVEESSSLLLSSGGSTSGASGSPPSSESIHVPSMQSINSSSGLQHSLSASSLPPNVLPPSIPSVSALLPQFQMAPMMPQMAHPMFGHIPHNIFASPQQHGGIFMPPPQPPFYMNNLAQGNAHPIPQIPSLFPSLPLPPPPPPPPIQGSFSVPPPQTPQLSIPPLHSSAMGIPPGKHPSVGTPLPQIRPVISPLMNAVGLEVNQNVSNAFNDICPKISTDSSVIACAIPEKGISIDTNSSSNALHLTKQPTVPTKPSFILYDPVTIESVEERRAKLQKYKARS